MSFTGKLKRIARELRRSGTDAWKARTFIYQKHEKFLDPMLAWLFEDTVGQVFGVMVSIIFPPIGIAVAAFGVAHAGMSIKEANDLAKDLARVYPYPPDDLITLLEYESGEMFDPDAPMSQQTAQVLRTQVRKGRGDQVMEYLREYANLKSGDTTTFDRVKRTGA